jgi:hypothetical protein
MCKKCLEDPEEFRVHIRQRLTEALEKPDLEVPDSEMLDLRTAITWAMENREKVGIDDATAAKLQILLDRYQEVEGDEELTKRVSEEASDILSSIVGEYQNVMPTPNPLDHAVKDSVETDQHLFPVEDLAGKFYRAIQHIYYFHETRPEFYIELMGQQFLNDVGNRMTTYAGTAMETLPQFNTVLLPLHNEGARDVLATIMTTVYLEALVAGYYAGSGGTDCYLWQSHELGPLGRADADTPAEVKIEKVLEKIAEHKEKNSD